MAEPVEVTLARLEERLAQLSDEVRHVHEEVSELKATAIVGRALSGSC